jgi:NTP pyrophosphatase (non-canonical NTP hydrolase)
MSGLPEGFEEEYLSATNDFNFFQEQCKQTAIYPKSEGLLYVTLGLMNECGEFGGHIKKMIRDGHIDDKAAAKELGDVCWYLAMCAEELGYDLSEIADMVIDKLKSRKERGVLGGSGDNR